jgi:hypothetical protein
LAAIPAVDIAGYSALMGADAAGAHVAVLFAMIDDRFPFPHDTPDTGRSAAMIKETPTNALPQVMPSAFNCDAHGTSWR